MRAEHFPRIGRFFYNGSTVQLGGASGGVA
jgi:hypothetical protein